MKIVREKSWETLNKASFVGKQLGQRGNEYGDSPIVYASFLAHKSEFVC